MKLLLATGGLAAVIGLALLPARPAHADANQDQAFLASLGASGITYKDPASAIAAGKTVCDMANQGKSGIEVVKAIQDGNPGLTQEHAAQFTAIAANVYCPAQLPGVKPAAGGG